MLVYLLHWLILEAEKLDIQQQSGVTGTGRKPAASQKKGTSKKSKAPANASLHDDFTWASLRERVLQTLLSVLKLRLSRLWGVDQPEESFLSLFSLVTQAVLENPHSSRATGKDMREICGDILGMLVDQYNCSVLATQSFLRLSQNYEHTATALADIVHRMVTLHRSGAVFVEDLLREIVGGADCAKDTSGTRNMASFLCELAEIIPGQLAGFTDLILPHLASEAYSMRSSVVVILGQILKLQHSETLAAQATEPDQMELPEIFLEPTTQRELFFKFLLQRVFDTSSYTRGRALQVLQMLVSERAVPTSLLVIVATLALGRVQDKTALVRKAAVQLLTTLLQFNSFSGELSPVLFEAVLQQHLEGLAGRGVDTSAIVSSYSQLRTTLEPLTRPPVKAAKPNHNSVQSQEPAEPAELTGATAFAATQFSDELQKRLALVVHFHKDALAFVKVMSESAAAVQNLLASKTVFDAQESIAFFSTANRFQLPGAEEGLRKMLFLIFARENSVKDAVLEAVVSLFFTASTEGDEQPSKSKSKSGLRRAEAISITVHLLNFVSTLGLAELTSFEEILGTLHKKSMVDAALIQAIFDIATGKHDDSTPAQQRTAMCLVSMLVAVDRALLDGKLPLLYAQLARPRSDAQADDVLIRFTCTTLAKSAAATKTGDARLPPSHELFHHLAAALMDPQVPPSRWFALAENVVGAIYILCRAPDMLAKQIIAHFTTLAFGTPESGASNDASVSSVALAQLLFVAGHVALKQMVFIETVQTELKLRRMQVDQQAEQRLQDHLAKTHAAMQDDDLESEQPTKGKKSRGKKAAAPVDAGESDGEGEDNERSQMEKDLGVGSAILDDTEADLFSAFIETELLAGVESLLSLYAPLVVRICMNPGGKFSDQSVRVAAVLSLAKFMCVSPSFCDAHMRLLFTLLATAPEAALRSNIVISLGDIGFRFPNIFEPWSSQLYGRLRDSSLRVRKTTLLVLTHLILNDMVKIKGQISEMAICLQDSDKRVSDLAKLFFHELSHKGNTIYNILPDAISTLSANSNVSNDMFKNIMKHLFAFIEKDKQVESLVEKLCHRLNATHEIQQWRNISHCLTLLSLNDRAVKKMSELFKCIQTSLEDEQVYVNFSALISKTRKFAKSEIKSALDELEIKVRDARSRFLAEAEGQESGPPVLPPVAEAPAADGDSDVDLFDLAAPAASSRPSVVPQRQPLQPSRTQTSKPAAKKSAPKKKAPVFESDDDDIDLFDLDDAPSKAQPKSAGRPAADDSDFENQSDAVRNSPLRKPTASRKRPHAPSPAGSPVRSAPSAPRRKLVVRKSQE
eukprot:TRINITY_DN5903_c0_g1_i2.p1 TRINITY_DN5903_c0_g1~~TRINITY_DN5903_c0_g1_i2.p1  ORF type:complete len:1468 (+),score=404.16 TRINITY_DN5903_c0_g1_i2:458-4405(+)